MSSKRNNPSSPSSSPPVNSKKKISCRSTGTTATTVPTPCCSKIGIKRGPWTPEEDELLSNYVKKNGEGRWRTLPKRAGLLRCGKSCRLRWMNYLRPSVKRGRIAPDEEDLILRLHRLLGNRWSLIAGRIPGRTDNEIKNYWNTHLSKKLISQGIDPRTHKPYNFNPNPNTNSSIPPSSSLSPSQIPHANNNNNNLLPITQKYYFNNPSFSDHLKKETASKIIHSVIPTNVSQKFSSITTKDQLEQYSQLNNQIESVCCPNVHDHDGKFFMGDNMCGKTSNQEVEEEEDNIIGNIGNDDDTFSSFLDSLINDNAFLYQEQEQHPSSSTQAFLSSAQTFTHGIDTWEDEVIMSSIAAVSSLGDEDGGALNNIIHPSAAS